MPDNNSIDDTSPIVTDEALEANVRDSAQTVLILKDKRKFVGLLSRNEAGGWQIVATEADAYSAGQKVIPFRKDQVADLIIAVPLRRK